MRIAQVTPVYPPYRGGIGSVAAQYTDGLRERGLDVVVFEPKWKIGNAGVMPSLMWRLRGSDIIHLHYPFYGGDLFAAIASCLWRIPLVVTFHMRTRASGLLGFVFSAHRLLCERWILGEASAVLVSSLDYAASVGLDLPTLVEMPFGVDTKRFTPGEKQDQPFTFLFVGGLDRAHYFKGVDVLIEAASELPPDEPWRVQIVGDGNLREEYEEHVRAHGMESRISFLGSVSYDQLPEVYRTADVHILPSIDESEAFGLVTLEAAASGVPSIVSDLPGVRTLIVPGETGSLVDPDDEASLAGAMRQMLVAPKRAHAMGEAARQLVVETYDEERCLDRLIAVYEQSRVKEV